jgi:hypothetical protein
MNVSLRAFVAQHGLAGVVFIHYPERRSTILRMDRGPVIRSIRMRPAEDTTEPPEFLVSFETNGGGLYGGAGRIGSLEQMFELMRVFFVELVREKDFPKLPGEP